MTTNDYKPQHSYQDDFGGGPDPIMNELDDPTEVLGIPPKEFAKELDKLGDVDEDLDQESLAA